QPSWEQTKVDRRCAIFRAASDEIRKDKYNYCAWLTLENGKNRFEAMAEVDEAIDYLRYYPRVLQEREGYVLGLDGPVPCNETRSVLRPLGVVGVISPFNFPLAITTGMVTGALITGNAVILKPPSDAPLMGHMLHGCLTRSGVPPGVFHFIAGPASTVGLEISENMGIAAIAFTGSREVGMEIARSSAIRGRRPPILEMGGKNPTIVSDKADLGKAVEGVGRAAFSFSGQKCSATSRVIVNRAVADEFTRALAAWVRDKKVGDPSRRDVFMGCVINRAAVDRFERTILQASKAGQVLAGGHVLKDGAYSDGFFVEPTILIHLASNHELALKELFLPVLIVLTYKDFDEAISIANKVEYGLTAGIFSEDPHEIQKFFTKIQAGVTYANRSQGATTGALVGAQPFVGWKSSGVTGKGTGGPYYLLQFLQEQSRTVCR
ncbi:MAG TPA: aldehyde dehydrogenase family protein, partial [Thermoplasmata archaeon]|nr:aldehyde dehydrogenase family protein [Thermoplasmata archaeon]